MSSKPECRRRPRIADRPLQLALLWKAILQWVLFTAVAFSVLLAWSFLGQPSGQAQGHLAAIWERHGVVFVVLVALLPVVVYDSFKFSHRLAGPMVRLRHTLHRLAQGEQIEPLKFRQRDYWHDVADDFNVLLARLEAREAETTLHVARGARVPADGHASRVSHGALSPLESSVE